MHAILLCDWTTVQGTTSSSPIVQGDDQWIDLTPYQEAVFWVDCREVTGTVTLNLETSPSRDDVYFKSMVNPTAGQTGISLVNGTAPVAYAALLASAPTPLARWVRWKLVGTGSTWDATFRIWASCNSPGM